MFWGVTISSSSRVLSLIEQIKYNNNKINKEKWRKKGERNRGQGRGGDEEFIKPVHKKRGRGNRTTAQLTERRDHERKRKTLGKKRSHTRVRNWIACWAEGTGRDRTGIEGEPSGETKIEPLGIIGSRQPVSYLAFWKPEYFIWKIIQ